MNRVGDVLLTDAAKATAMPVLIPRSFSTAVAGLLRGDQYSAVYHKELPESHYEVRGLSFHLSEDDHEPFIANFDRRRG